MQKRSWRPSERREGTDYKVVGNYLAEGIESKKGSSRWSTLGIPDKDKQMLKDKKKYKDDLNRDDQQNQGEIENFEKDLDGALNDLENGLNLTRLQLISNYEKKLGELKEELELRMKVEIHEIEERKN